MSCGLDGCDYRGDPLSECPTGPMLGSSFPSSPQAHGWDEYSPHRIGRRGFLGMGCSLGNLYCVSPQQLRSTFRGVETQKGDYPDQLFLLYNENCMPFGLVYTYRRPPGYVHDNYT